MIFRKVALERLSSPEQLDQLLQVTRPRGWLALAALGLVVAAAVAWGFTGSIPTEALGEGILIRRGGVSDLVVTGQGQVEEVRVAVGDTIEKGQVVATLRQDELMRQIDDARERLDGVVEEYRALIGYADEQKRLKRRNLAQQRASLERSVASLERDHEILSERIEAERGLLADGLITKQTLLASEQELNSVSDQIAAKRLDLAGLPLSQLEAEQQVAEQIDARERELRDLERQVADLRAKLAENANVVSPFGGRVLELVGKPGDVIDPGERILSLEVASEELMAVLFVPAAAGKQVRAGMGARISPSTVQREEYGFILGEVTWVSEFPATSLGMMRLLSNQELVTKLMEQGPPIQVEIALERDPATPTGFAWSSSRGPDLAITSGTLASGGVIVREDPPIRLVVPSVRKRLGL